MDDNLRNKVRATIEGRSISNPNFFSTPVTKDIVRGVVPTIKKIPGAVSQAATDFSEGTEELRQKLPDWLKPFTPVVRGADLAKTFAQEIAAGGVSLAKSAVELAGLDDDKFPKLRSKEQQQKLEQNLFGREVKSIQEQYVRPAQQFAEAKGSGQFEKAGLGTAAVGIGFFAESPFGRLVPGSRGVFRSLLKEDLKTLVKEVDTKKIADIIASRGISRTAISDDAIQRIANATNESQINRVLDSIESSIVRNAELAPRVAERAKAKTTQPPPPEITIPRRVTPEPQVARTSDGSTSVDPAQTRQNIRDRVKATLDEAEYIDREVMPGSPQKQIIRSVADVAPVKGDTISVSELSRLSKNSLENNQSGIRPQSIEAQRAIIQPGQTPERAVEVRVIEDGTIDIVDGRHLLETARQSGVNDIKIKDVTADYFPEGIPASQAVKQTSTSPEANKRQGVQAADEVPVAAQKATPEGQSPTVPTKTSSNSEILSSLEQSNTKQAEIARESYAQYKDAYDKIIGSKWLSIREGAQDAFIRMRKLQQAVVGDKPIPDDINVDQAETLFHGRVNARLEDIGDEVRSIDTSITRSAKSLNVDVDEMRLDVSSYLHAKHAPERNAKLGDGAAGMTDADAAKTMEALKATGRLDAIKTEADKLLALNRKVLDILKEGQLIDNATYTLLRETYKNHVPLMRVMDEGSDIVEILSGKGFSVKSSGLKRAKGSDREVADITGNIVQAVEQAIVRSEKNLVNLSTARWARANKDLGIIKEVKPKAVGKTFDEQGAILEDLSKNPRIISFFEDGKRKYLEVQDGKLARVLSGVNVEGVPTVFRPVAVLTRFYGQLHTRFNYEFAFSNAVRDVQEMAVDMASRDGMGFGGAGKSIKNVPASQKAITDWLYGRDTEGARLYKQMREDGGTTGGLGLSTRQEIDMEIQRIQKLNQSSPRKAAARALRAIDNWNRIFEDGTRLGVYKAALDRGLSRQQAAVLAKESTINFNKKGTQGPIVNGLFMFANASIQGTTKVLRAMKNPKVAAATITSITATVEIANQWNDSIDPEWRDKVTKWDRSANLVVMLPSDTEDINYITIPISWGLKPIKMSVEYVSDLAKGKVDVIDGMQGILVSVLQAYNPLAGDESLLRTLTPTVLKTPVEISSNRGWHGNAIKPAYDINAPASSQYFPSLGNSTSGRFFINLTEGLSNRGIIEMSPADVDYAFKQYIGGVGRSIDRIVTAVDSIGEDDPLPAKETPILNRFYKTRDQEQVYADMFYTRREQADKEKSRERVLNYREIQPLYEEAQLLKESGDTAAAQRIVNSLTDEQYEIYKKLRASDMRRANVGAQIQQYGTVRKVEELVQQGKTAEAQRIVETMTDEEYKAYQDAKSALGVEF